MAVRKLIARQEANQKLLLKEWKAELLNNRTTKINKINKVYKEAIKARRKEIEKQREQLQIENEMLGKRIRELEIKKNGQYKDEQHKAIDPHQKMLCQLESQPKR